MSALNFYVLVPVVFFMLFLISSCGWRTGRIRITLKIEHMRLAFIERELQILRGTLLGAQVSVVLLSERLPGRPLP